MYNVVKKVRTFVMGHQNKHQMAFLALINITSNKVKVGLIIS